MSHVLSQVWGRVSATLLAALLLAASVVVLGASPAQACRCAPQGVAAQARSADLVVTGTVLGVRDGGVRSEEGNDRPRQQFGNVTLAVEVDRVYAGRLPDPVVDVTTAAASSACGLGRLPRGERYVFFLTSEAQALRATSCNGTTPLTGREVAQVERVLGEGRAVTGAGTPAEPDPQVERTVVDDEPAPDMATTALPGGLLAAAGLVGLLVLSRLGSRR